MRFAHARTRRPALRNPSRRSPAALLGLALLTLPGSAIADGDALVGQSRGEPVPVPNDAPRRAPAGEPLAASQGRIFVNFDGATLSDGWDDSTANVTQIGECAGNFAAYGEGAKRDAVMQAVRDDWAAYNVLIVDDRPDSGDYTMNMTGPSNPFGGGVLGIAPLDCDDSQTHNNITYAFHSINDNFDASTTATTIGQEVAHSYGLEHVDEPGDIMNPFNAGGDPSFTDVCLGIVANGGIVCGSQHAAECGSSSQQNSHQELLTLFGPSMPDGASPSVSITSPSDGTNFDEGSTFEITVDATDDVGIEQVALFNNGEQIQTDGSSPYGWTVENAPAGSYEFYVEATDPSGNVSMSNTVTVSVGGVMPTDDSGDDGNDGSPSDDGDGGSNDAGDDDGASAGDADDGAEGDDAAFGDTGDGSLPPGFGLDREAQSCACSSETGQRASPSGKWLVVLALVGVGRRRRRASARETS